MRDAELYLISCTHCRVLGYVYCSPPLRQAREVYTINWRAWERYIQASLVGTQDIVCSSTIRRPDLWRSGLREGHLCINPHTWYVQRESIYALYVLRGRRYVSSLWENTVSSHRRHRTRIIYDIWASGTHLYIVQWREHYIARVYLSIAYLSLIYIIYMYALTRLCSRWETADFISIISLGYDSVRSYREVALIRLVCKRRWVWGQGE